MNVDVKLASLIDKCQYVGHTGVVSVATVSISSNATGSAVSALAGCCAPVTGGLIDQAAAESLAHVFKALGDPTRVRLLSLIAAAEDGEACVCDLIKPVGLSQPTVSHHMKLLVDAGLVGREQRGKWAYYRVINETLIAMRHALEPMQKG
jgi:ArsR family transcriptional regulator, arsenate/arsenite/antimonite-responsive transcriptional repressor